ncbi:hypothetical protein SP5_109_00030 [Sphingomonas parapaucimobilis NBRC 15100]|uniref:RiboL-PSP-HEPN domain-containing protein n=2 Tax=Sphingomonas parapaucimobilis TaxID=28213 RepID=A0A0A1WBZ3_9SPHN|nr:hypothetical protein SP5_109_00030 [Sphingomonas parapaucimobilis NBRC 15100]
MPRALIEFDCPKPACPGVVSEAVYVSDPDFTAEKMSDGDVFEEHDIVCPICGEDYQVDTINGMGGYSASVDGDDVVMSLESDEDPDDYEDFLLRYVPANDQEGAFENARNELVALLTTFQPAPDSILARMIYSQLIAIMEAYLSDKILQLAMNHTEIKKRLAQKAGFVQNQTLKLTDVLLDPTKAENAFKIGLQNILYHDLEKVEKLYNVGLNIGFYPPNSTIKTNLEASVKIRHDCVHRNGVNKDGYVHSFDDTTIRTLAKDLTNLVHHLENATAAAVAALP